MVILLLLFLLPLTTAQYPICGTTGNYTANSTYEANLRIMASILPMNASIKTTRFATGVVGNAPDSIYALTQCEGDVDVTYCTSCAIAAFQDANQFCAFHKQVTVYHDQCMLTFSNINFLANTTNEDMATLPNPKNFSDVSAQRLLFVLLRTTAQSAANNMQRFSTSRLDVSSTTTMYCRAQCTLDLTADDCSSCLQDMVTQMFQYLDGRQGGRFEGTRCNTRYEEYQFFGGDPMVIMNSTGAIVNPKAQQPSAAPPPEHIGGNVRMWGEQAATILSIILGIAVILLSIFSVILWRNARPKLSYEEDVDDPSSLIFDLATLRHATDNFDEGNMLGHGGFGAVYKGVLPHGQQIAVKRLDKASHQGLKELRNELLLVAKLRHNNLTKLHGVCLEGGEKLLVYEYLPNRSLDTFLFAPEIEKRLLLNWEIRYRVIYGTARGLLYLHEDSHLKIIHRDLKAGNILLDADMHPKISDFGLARLFNSDKTTTITTQVVGTLGYMAPEYAVMGHLSVKSDVYSFGILILEIITGWKTSNISESAIEDDRTLLSYVWDQWVNGTPLDVLDASLDGEVTQSEVLKCIHLGLLCVQENPADRPTMLDILVMLHADPSSFAAPLKPAFTFTYHVLSSPSVRTRTECLDQHTQRAAPAVPCLSTQEMSVSEIQPR